MTKASHAIDDQQRNWSVQASQDTSDSTSEGAITMSDERNVQQPQDELSEEQLTEVSGAGGGGEGQPTRANTTESKPKPENKQGFLTINMEDVIISS
jgi:hypothetical protein